MPLQLPSPTPLRLGGPETARNQLIVWDPECEAETRDAKAQIHKLQGEGFRIGRSDIGEVQLLPPERDPHICVFRTLSQNGDDRVIWDRRCANQVREAFKKFKELLAKGYTAYATRADGSRGHKIHEFDPGLQEILLSAAEVLFVPRTVPG